MSSQAQPSSSRPYVPCPPPGVSRRTALVTGSSSGIGKGIARHLALQGFDVGLTMMPGESSEELEKFANDLETTYGIETIRHEVDFSKPEQACPQLMQDFMQKLGRIDVLVNCAGITAFNNTPFKALGDKLEPGGDPARQAEAIAGKIREGMDVNFVTPFLLSHEAVQHMLKQQAPDQRADISVDSSRANPEELFWTKAWGQGRIINITSVHAETPLMKSTIYVATKHALRGLTINMAVELASEGILVNAVGPGMIASNMTHLKPEDVEKPEHHKSALPVPRPGTPAEVAGAVGYLCSMAARYTTGQTIYCDGGFLIANPQYFGLQDGVNDV